MKKDESNVSGISRRSPQKYTYHRSRKLLMGLIWGVLLLQVSAFANAFTVLNNDRLRFGTGAENSVNATGNLQQPFYYNQPAAAWRKLTYSTLPLNFSIAAGGDGTTWWNLNGTQLDDGALMDQVINTDGFTATDGGTKGYGVIVSTGTVTVGESALQIRNTYELPQGKSYLKVTTRVTNTSGGEVSNLRYWVGTRDDWVGETDRPVKEKGNLVDGAFVRIANAATQALAIRIKAADEGVLFYTDTDKANTIINGYGAWSVITGLNPAESAIVLAASEAVGDHDGAYGFYVRFNDLANGAYDEFVWYYAAGELADLDDIVNDVANAAGSVQNISYSTADFNATSSVSGTGYYVVVARDAVAPTEAQIKAGGDYGGVTVVDSGNGAVVADVERSYALSGLTAETQYDLYFVVEDNQPVFSAISKSQFTTAAYQVPTLSATTAAGTITAGTATSGGTIDDDGSDGARPVTARGVCWSTGINPTTANSCTTDGTGTGVFSSSLTGLTSNTLYYVRAYATNAVGTGYGPQVSFTTLNTYTIAYHANNATGGSAPASQTKTHNVELTLRTNSGSLARTGYSYSGWNTAANGLGTDYAEGGSYTANAAATLYAKWSANSYTVTFDKQGGAGESDSVSATYTSAMPAATAPTRTGYTFGGYYSAANGAGTQYYTGAMASAQNWDVPAATTLYAKWTANSYTVTFDKQEGAGGSASVSATYDSTMPVATAPTRTGYTFGGYYTAADGAGTQYYMGAMVSAQNWDIASATTLYASWTPNDYTVTFDKQEGVGGSASVSATYTAAMPAATAPTRSGYTFGGYYTAADGAGTQYYTGAMASAQNWDVTSATTLYAKWTANSYTVTFDKQEGAGGSASVSATYDSAMPAATAPTRTGYTFGGYYTATNGAGTPYYTAAMNSVRNWDVAGSATLYAKWTANSYTVTFDQQSGSGGSVGTTATYDSAMPAATAPSRTGYTFGGYYSAANGAGTQYYTAVMSSVRSWDVASALTLYAKWTANSYTVSLDQQSGSEGSASVSATYDAAMPAATAPTREGYTFGGYYSAPNGGGTPYYTAAMSSVRSWDVAGNATLYAQWLVNAYTLSFDSVGGSAVAAITQDFGSAVSAPTAPTREGYTFAGWTPAVPATMPAANQTHTAQWTVNGYTLSFDSAGGSAVAAITQDFGSAVSAPATPTREGYTFAGWLPEIPGTMPAASQTHTAQWTVNSYTLSFDSAGGSDVAAITQDFGTAITAPADPTREGYTFAGWQPEIPATLPAANQTHTAEWTAHTFTLTYRAGTGGTLEGESTQQVDYQEDGSEVTAVADEGYQFVEWSDGQTSNPRQDRSITEDLNVEAQFASLHTIGGVLNGLSEGEIVLGLNGGFDSLTLSEEGSFVFSKPLLHGSSYAVVIVEQPEGYTCAITRGRGTVSADVTGVSVGCLVVEDDRPQVAFGSTRQFGTQGEELLIQVVLEGTPKQYPVKVAYEVSGFDAIAQSQPELAVSGEFEFLEEHERTRTLRVVPGTSAGEIRFSLVPTEGIEYGQVGNPAQHTIVLYEPEVVPMIGALKVKQGGIPPTENNLVVPGQGAVTLEVEIDTAVSYDWSVSSAELGIDTQTDAVVSVIEPLPEEGTYPVKVVLREQEGTRTLTLQLNLRVAAVIPEEYFEFYDDVYQEEPHRLPVCPGGEFRVGACTAEEEPVYLEVPEGLTVDLGVQSESASWTSNEFALSIEPDDLKDETGSPAANREDSEFTHLGYLVDFEVSGLDLPGQSIPLVIPLPSGQTVPARAVWRKYHGAEIGWRDFVVDAANQIYSSSRTALGSCPWPGAKVWSEGLSEGHECVRLIIQDGGPNDLDGMTDGVIRDPGTLAVPASEKVVIRSKGGSVSVWWLALLSLLPLSGAWQRRRGQWKGKGKQAYAKRTIEKEGKRMSCQIDQKTRFEGFLQKRGFSLNGTSSARCRLRSLFLPCLVCGLLAGALLASPVRAEGGWYLGATLGRVNGEVGSSDVNRELTARGVVLTSPARVDESDRNGWRLLGGYEWQSNGESRVALEWSYTDLGEAETELNLLPLAQTLDAVQPALPALGTGVELSVLGFMPISSALDLYGRLGVWRWEAEYQVAGINDKNSETGLDLLYGAGLRWQLTPEWSTRLNLDRYRVDSQNVTLFGLSLIYGL